MIYSGNPLLFKAGKDWRGGPRYGGVRLGVVRYGRRGRDGLGAFGQGTAGVELRDGFR